MASVVPGKAIGAFTHNALFPVLDIHAPLEAVPPLPVDVLPRPVPGADAVHFPPKRLPRLGGRSGRPGGGWIRKRVVGQDPLPLGDQQGRVGIPARRDRETLGKIGGPVIRHDWFRLHPLHIPFPGRNFQIIPPRRH